MLCLQMDFHHGAVVEDRCDTPHEELGEPVRIDVLLEESARSPG
jgi:hypothetical protein